MCCRRDIRHEQSGMALARRTHARLRNIQRYPGGGSKIPLVLIGDGRPTLSGHPVPALSQGRNPESTGDSYRCRSGRSTEHSDAWSNATASFGTHVSIYNLVQYDDCCTEQNRFTTSLTETFPTDPRALAAARLKLSTTPTLGTNADWRHSLITFRNTITYGILNQ